MSYETSDRPAADLTTDELKHELLHRQKEERALLDAFPEFEEIRNVDPASPEEDKLARTEERIRELKLELVSRGETPHESGSALLRSKPDIVKRRAIIVQNANLSAGDLCKRFDLEGIPLAENWSVEFEVQTWVKAYKNGKCRSRIDTLISKERKKLK